MITAEELATIKISIENIISELKLVKDQQESHNKAYQIDKQKFLVANQPLLPSTKPKVSYSQDGLVIGGFDLDVKDLPNVPIDKIIGLRNIIDELSQNNVKELQTKLAEFIKNKKTIEPGTGTKITYDENGRVVSSSSLLIGDLPNIPINKINGLDDRIRLLESSMKEIETPSNSIIAPGTYIKVTCNSDGRVVSGSKHLSISDIPVSLTNQINTIESMIPTLASQESLSGVSTILKSKISSMPPIKSGKYTKVTVRDNGLVSHGEKLSIEDLPTMSIDDIVELSGILKKKADSTELMDVNRNLRELINNISIEIELLQQQMKTRMSIQDGSTMKKHMEEIQKTNSSIISKLPSDTMMLDFVSMQKTIESFNTRLMILEKHLKIVE